MSSRRYTPWVPTFAFMSYPSQTSIRSTRLLSPATVSEMGLDNFQPWKVLAMITLRSRHGQLVHAGTKRTKRRRLCEMRDAYQPYKTLHLMLVVAPGVSHPIGTEVSPGRNSRLESPIYNRSSPRQNPKRSDRVFDAPGGVEGRTRCVAGVLHVKEPWKPW